MVMHAAPLHRTGLIGTQNNGGKLSFVIEKDQISIFQKNKLTSNVLMFERGSLWYIHLQML